MENFFSAIDSSFGSVTAFWVITTIIGVVIVAVVAILVTMRYQSRRVSFVLSDAGLAIGPGHYSRFIPMEDIESEGIRVVNMKKEAAFRPEYKARGSKLPWFSSGWFELANNEMALLFVTDRSRVVYIPTNKDYSVLLSVRDAERFANDLQNWG